MTTTPKKHKRLTIGVLSGWQVYEGTLNSFINPVINGIQVAATQRDCNLLLACGVGHRGDYRVDDVHPAWPILMQDTDFVPVGPWNTDGLIILSPMRSEARSRYVQELIDSGFPVVLVAPGEKGPTLVFDNEDGVHQAIAHLVEHGHKNIALISGLEEGSSDSEYRLKAFQAAIHQYGLNADPRLIASGGFYTPGGYQAMQQIMDSGVAFSAVLAFNDESAIGAMRALREGGRRIPEDVAIIGFDDRLEAQAQIPPLTSVRQPMVEIGYQALELLLKYIHKEKAAPEIIRVPARLTIRRSCGCRPGSAAIIPPALAITDGLNGSAPHWLARAMRTSLPTSDRSRETDDAFTHCERLANALIESLAKNDPEFFDGEINNMLMRVEALDEDPHNWQAVISVLQQNLPVLLAGALPIAGRASAEEMLHHARIVISESAQRRYIRNVVLQSEITDQLGRMSARLHTAFDESHIFEILGEVLPRFGIQHAHVAIFETEEKDNDPVAWSRLRTLVGAKSPEPLPMRLPSRSFPPQNLYPGGAAFQVALLPLIIREGLSGYMIFDAAQLEPCAAIVRQLESALRSAQLYQEAAEGRRLAEEADRLKGGFLSMVSHELRTPLNLIVGLSEILMRDPGPDQPVLPTLYGQDVKRIHASAQHLGWLIRDVLDMASSEAGQLRLTYEQVNLLVELRAVADVGEQLSREKGLEWLANLPAELPAIWGDHTRLRQVILNLVSNAVKFTPRGGKTTLSAETSDSEVIISVTDTGLGIALEEQAVIFNEFRQSERTMARGYSGMGLGLAICKRLVELHGGTISVMSSGEEGSGSTFYVRLPIWGKQDIAPEKPAPTHIVPDASQRSVLVLSANANSIERVYNHLAAQGFDVDTLLVDANVDLRERLLKARPGALVLDLNLASERGWEILRLLKSNPASQDVPMLFYSLSLENGTGSWLEMDTLTKPVSMDDLSQALARQGLLGGGEEKTILIVDDDAGIREMNARIVQAQSKTHRVLKARDGREALEMMRHRPVDLVLLDLMMPELDGFGVLEAMRDAEMTRDIPVIVLTAKMLTEVDMLRLNRGVATVLEKGLFSVEETLVHIEEVLALNHKLGSEAQRLVRKGMAYLHEHYTESLTRDNIARYVGVSEDYLTRCFQQELRMPPMTYLTRYRINQAKELLAAGKMSVAEVAEAVGFSGEVYFNRVFSREVQVTPGAYRRGQRAVEK